MPNDNKLVNLADLKAAFDDVNDRAGVVSVNGQTGAVSITPANIGAHPARSILQLTSNSSYTGTPANAIVQPVAQILDPSGFIRHQMYGVYNTDESFYTYIGTRRPSGSSVVTNNIAIGFDANGNAAYNITYPEAFRSAIGVTPANNLTTTEAGKVLDARQGVALKALIDGLISNTSLGTYSGYAVAAEAVWAAMGNTSVKVGKITIELSSTNSYIAVYLAVKSSDNYAAVLFVSYSTTLHLAIKLSGTTTVRNISTTAE